MSQTKAQLISDLVQALNFTGTSSAPANGVYLSAANTISLSTNSNGPKITIKSDGTIGIGLTAPSNLLHIKDPTTSGAKDIFHVESNGGGHFLVKCNDTAAANPGWQLRTYASEDIQLSPGNNVVMHLDATDQRVGIGTTIPDNLLHLYESSTTQTANTESQLVLEKNSDSGITILSGYTSNGRILFGDSGDNDIGQIDYNHNNNSLTFVTAASTALTLDNNQIATFGDDIRATGASDIRLTLGSTGTVDTNDSVHIRGDSADLKFMAASGGGTYFESNGSSTLTILSTGKVGIGTTAPGSLLELNAANDTAQLKFLRTGTTIGGTINTRDESGSKGLTYTAQDANSGVPQHVFSTNDGSAITERFRITHTGKIESKNAVQSGGNTTGGFQFDAVDTTCVLGIQQPSSGADTNAAIQVWDGSSNNLRINYSGLIKTSEGIDFSGAQTNVAGMTSEVLDSYEEGTFTPTWGGAEVSSITYSTQFGKYTKIGNRVFGQIRLTATSFTGSGGVAQINGFPFTAFNNTSSFHHFTFGHLTGFSYTGAPYGYLVSNYNHGKLITNTNGTNASVAYPSSTTIDIIASFMYEAA